ncbi:MAG: MobV family relaxase [Cyanobacteria bacterium P01_A01_bin.45]
MSLTVCRIQKIKSWGTLKGNEAHTLRERETANANPEIDNVRIIDDASGLDLVTLVKNKIGPQKIRSNAVLAIEILLSASADYFRPDAPHEAGVYDKQRLDKFVEATVKWLHSSWGERVVRAELHLDEITPHIHAYIVPLDERGKLNCRRLFGGRINLSQLQDSFAEAVAHLGISRGIKGSTAKHTKLKKYYAAVNQESQLLNLEHSFPKPQANEECNDYRQRVIEILYPQFEIINYQLNERSRLIRQKSQLEQTARRSEKLRQQLESELHILQTTVKPQKLSLDLVTYELGLNVNASRQVVSQNDAVEMVMQVNQCNFEDAVIWLSDRFGKELMITAVTNHSINQALSIANRVSETVFTLPVPDGSHWGQLERYLHQNYSIPQEFLRVMNQRGLIYADASENAVFLMRNLASQVTGAYLHPFNSRENTFSLYPQSKRFSGWFHLSVGETSNNPVVAAVITSSPIDALSLVVFNSPHKHRTLYLSVDNIQCMALGEHHAPIPLQFLKTLPHVVIAYGGSFVYGGTQTSISMSHHISNKNAEIIQEFIPGSKILNFPDAYRIHEYQTYQSNINFGLE